MSIESHFSQSDWERIKRDWTAWWHHDINRPMIVINVFEWQGKAFVQLLKRIRDGRKLCQVYATPTTVRTITSELGGKGFAFWIDESMSQDEANGLLRDIGIN